MNNLIVHGLIFAKVHFVLCNIVRTISEEKHYLMQLPLTELLKISQSLAQMDFTTHDKKQDNQEEEALETTDHLTEGYSNDGLSSPYLRSAQKLVGNYIEKEYETSAAWNERPTKIQTAFQVSITALSFLAFGGYLLCMIVQAIKSKGTTYLHSTIGMNNNSNGINTLKRIKIYQRARRANRNMRQAEPSPEELLKISATLFELYIDIISF